MVALVSNFKHLTNILLSQKLVYTKKWYFRGKKVFLRLSTVYPKAAKRSISCATLLLAVELLTEKNLA